MNNNIHRQLLDSVREYADAHAMLRCTDIIVGYSGGADSSLLLYALSHIAAERGVRVCAAHINHMFRGDEADSDEAFCREQCSRMGIPFRSLSTDVGKLARERSQSDEECAREVRYGFFSDIACEIEAAMPDARVYIATAHNATDNAETVIFNLTRGAAICGMSGIPPVRDGHIIRPILHIPKEQVLSYCAQLGIDYVTDRTNVECVYTRNRIRHMVLPQLHSINPSLEAAVLRMTESLREDAEYLECEARALYSSFHQGHNRALTCEMLLSIHRALRSRVLCLFFEENGAGYEHTHIDCAMRLISRGGDFSLSLIGKLRLVSRGGTLRIEPDEKTSAEAEEWSVTLSLGENILPEGRIFVCRDAEEIEKIKTQNVYNLFIQHSLSGDTINNTFVARSRREGDVILSGGHRHKVKKLFSDGKIPREKRPCLPIVERDGDIVWIPTLRARDGEGSDNRHLYFAYTVE